MPSLDGYQGHRVITRPVELLRPVMTFLWERVTCGSTHWTAEIAPGSIGLQWVSEGTWRFGRKTLNVIWRTNWEGCHPQDSCLLESELYTPGISVAAQGPLGRALRREWGYLNLSLQKHTCTHTPAHPWACTGIPAHTETTCVHTHTHVHIKTVHTQTHTHILRKHWIHILA